MPDLCIMQPIADKIKKAIDDDKFDYDTLINGNTAQRRQLWEKIGIGSDELIDFVNTGFEKAVASQKLANVEKYMMGLLKPESPEAKMYSKIFKDAREAGVFQDNETLYADFARSKLGINLNEEQFNKLEELTSKLDGLSNKFTETGVLSPEWGKAKSELENYVSSINPTSWLGIWSGIIARANLLGLPSAVTNVLSNIAPATSMSVVRRTFASVYGEKFLLKGDNPELAAQTMRDLFALKNQSGIDATRGIAETDMFRGEKAVHVEGTTKARKAVKIYSDIIFDKLQGYPDFVSGAGAYGDAINLYSTAEAQRMVKAGKITQAERATKAAEILKDANGALQTAEGQRVRLMANVDAALSTWTEGFKGKGWESFKGSWSEAITGVRGWVDSHTGDWMAGTFSLPFLKQPGNAIQRGLQASSGYGLVKGVVELPGALRSAGRGDPIPLLNSIRKITESGLGLGVAAAIAYSLPIEDFIPDISMASPSEKAMVKAKNGTYNSIKIGDYFVSLDYFGLIAPALVGFLYAKKFPDNPLFAGMGFAKAELGAASRLPGLDVIYKAIGDGIEAAQELESGEQEDQLDRIKRGGGAFAGSLVSGIISRLIPFYASVSNVDKATDVAQREKGKDFVSQVIYSVPGLRRALPEKVSQVTGETIKPEPWWETILFGSRVKKAEDDPVVQEVARLHEVGYTPTISDIDRYSSVLKDIRTQIGEAKFNELVKWYGTNFHERAMQVINGETYKSWPADQKKDKLDSIRKALLEGVKSKAMAEYGYKKPQQQKVTVK
jgi:hypothetical protein